MRTITTVVIIFICIGGVGCNESETDGTFGKPMTRLDHEAIFPIVDGEHGGVECASCHAESPAFRDFTCLSCHEHDQEPMDAIHLSLAGYEFDSPACYGCHPRGEGSVEHASYFPIDRESKHDGIGCSECHSALRARGYDQNKCADCHASLPEGDLAEQHGLVGEFAEGVAQVTSAGCKQCHAESQVDRIDDHGPFLIQDTLTKEAPHEKESCLECHTSRRDDKDWAADFEQKSCFACHLEPEMGDVHGPLPAYEYVTTACLTCHPDGTKDVVIEHEDSFPIAPGTEHNEVSCSACHTAGSSTQNLCLTCHTTELEEDLTAIHGLVGEFQADRPAVDSASCKRCHAESQVDRIIDHTPFLVADTAGTVTMHEREDCLGCHTASRDDKAWATNFEEKSCASCHLEPDMNLVHGPMPAYEYTTTACLTCHPDGTGALSIIEHEDSFPIGPPTAHGEVSCAGCHVSSSSTENLCLDCHTAELNEDMATIHGLVGEFQSDRPAVDSIGCKQCHAESQVDRVEDHGPFLIADTPDTITDHKREDCLGCHTTARTDKAWAADFEAKSCASCHLQPEMNTSHSLIAAYEYTTTACLTCHPDGTGAVNNIDHESSFPLVGGAAHNEIGCAECHALGSATVNLCLDCHTGELSEDLPALHSLVGEFQPGRPAVGSVGCKSCHAESQVDRIADHGPFLIATANGTTSLHEREDCFRCHTSTRADKDWAADFGQKSCAACHLEPDMIVVHGPLPGYDYATTACLTCHPDGTKDVTIDHESSFPLAGGAAHNEIACAACHAAGSSTQNLCLDCHTTELSEDLPALHSLVGEFQAGRPTVDSADCKACHAESQVDRIADHGPFLIESGNGVTSLHEREDCLRCHTSTRADKNWAADFDQKSCAACHLEPAMAVVHGPLPGYDYTTTACLTCHPDGTDAVTIDHEASFPLAAPAVHNEVSCASCHAVGSTTQTLCLECHTTELAEDLPAIHTAVGEFQAGQPAVDSGDCKRCHAESQVDPVDTHGVFLVNQGSGHYRENCLECHASSRPDKTWAADFTKKECITCHEQGPTASIHTGIGGYIYATTTCLSCHPDGGAATNIDHEAYFPLEGNAEHNGISCSACHLNVNDRSVVGCRECHVGTEGQNLDADHQGVGEFTGGSAGIDSNACKQCHADSQVDPVAAHGAFLITDGQAHFEENCLECHSTPRTDKPWAADFTKRDCLQCHLQPETTSDHNGVSGFAYDTQSCLTCHPDGTGAININHEPIFPLAAGTSHNGISCGDCHLNANDTTQNGCYQCHLTESDITGDHNGVRAPNNNWGAVRSVDCKMCHGDSQVDTVGSHVPFRITNGDHRRTCTGCHEQARPEKPFAIDFPIFSCSECHSRNDMDDKHSGENGYNYDNFPSCLNCHPDGRED